MDLRSLVRSAARRVAAAASDVATYAVKLLSITSRIHLFVLSGERVQDLLCCLEGQDVRGMTRAMSKTRDIPDGCCVWERKLGEYSCTLVAVPWPCRADPVSVEKFHRRLESTLCFYLAEQRELSCVTLVAECDLLCNYADVLECVSATKAKLERCGCRPLVVCDRCTNASHKGNARFSNEGPFSRIDDLHVEDDFFTLRYLHELVAKKTKESDVAV